MYPRPKGPSWRGVAWRGGSHKFWWRPVISNLLNVSLTLLPPMLVIVGSPRVESEVKTFQIRLHTWVSHDHVYQNPRRRFQGLEVKEPNRLSSPSGTSPSRRTNQSSPSIRRFLRHSCIDPVGPMLFLCIV